MLLMKGSEITNEADEGAQMKTEKFREWRNAMREFHINR